MNSRKRVRRPPAKKPGSKPYTPIAPGGPEETEDLEDIAQDDEDLIIGPPRDGSEQAVKHDL